MVQDAALVVGTLHHGYFLLSSTHLLDSSKYGNDADYGYAQKDPQD